jgi:hypothetical protein
MTEEATKRLLGTLNRDPVAFVDDIVKELEAHGVTNKDDQALAISRIIGRQTSQREVTDILLARKQMQNETEGLEQGASVDQGLAGYDKNIHAAQQAMDAAWHNLQVALGNGEGEKLAAIINQIAGSLNGITGVVNKMDPGTLDAVFKVVAGIGIALVAIGGIALASLVGIPVALSAIAVAFGALALLEWEKVRAVLLGINSAISAFIDSIAALYDRVKGMFTQGPQTPEQKQFHENLDNANKNYVPMRFTPGTDSHKPMQAAFSLNVDGQTLAQSVIDHLGSLYDNATGAPSSDGVSSPFGGDHQYGSV